MTNLRMILLPAVLGLATGAAMAQLRTVATKRDDLIVAERDKEKLEAAPALPAAE